MKIALFGGSFDPPHLAHEKIIHSLLKNFDFDKIIIMPAFISMNKTKSQALPEVRKKWLEILFGDLARVEISCFELKQKRQVPTLLSVKYLLSLYPNAKISVVIGSDNAKNLASWQGYDELKTLASFIISKRPGSPCKEGLIDLNLNISSAKIKEKADFTLVNDKIRKEVISIYKGDLCKE